jgi:acyl carrier protein
MDHFLQLIRTTLRLDTPIDPDTPLISSGIIDSFDVVTMLTMFESEYGVSIAPEEIDVERFDTPTQMLSYVDGSQS